VSSPAQLSNPGSHVVLSVRVVDAQNNPVPNAQFATTVSGGNGTLTQLTTQAPDGTYQFDFLLGSDTSLRTVTICLANLQTQCVLFRVGTNEAAIISPANSIITPQAIAAVTSATQQLGNIRLHLDNLRLTHNPTVTQGLNVSYNGQSLPPLTALALAPTDKDGKPLLQKGGGAAADKDPFEHWGVFVQGDLDVGKLNGSGAQTGFDIRTKGLTLGTDFRFTGNHVLGASLGLVKANADLDNNAGNQDTKGWSVSVFGEYVPVENAYIDLTLNYGQNKYDGVRRASDPIQPATTVEYNSNPRGNQFALALSAGYQFYHKAWTLNPYGRLEYVDASIDAFQETGGAGALQISNQRYKSTVLTLGGLAQYAASVAWGVLVPYVRAEYQYAAQTSSNSTSAQLVVPLVGGTPPVGVGGANADRSYGNVAAGVSGVWPHGFSGYFNYQYLFGQQNFNDSRYTLGIRYEF
jgi:outer membrane autotransporter protein